MAKKTNEILIRLYDMENGDMVRAFYTTETKAILDMYTFAMNNDIEVSVPYDDNNEENKYNNTNAYIKEIEMGFGNETQYPYINFWAEVFKI